MSAMKPADANIAVVLSDLNRYENQNYSNPATAKRTLKILSLTEERLAKSTHQEDPSWKAAKERLDLLKARLEKGDAAKPPTPSSPTASVASPVVETHSAHAAPSKPVMISSDRARVKKLQRDITFAMQTLNGDGPDRLTDVNYRQRMQTNLERFANQLTAFQQFTDDPDVLQAKKALDEFQEMLLLPASGQQSHSTPTVSPGEQTIHISPQTRSMITQERLRVQKMKRDIESAQRMIDSKRFSDPSYLPSLNAFVERMEGTLKGYEEFASDADVANAHAALSSYKAVVTTTQKEAEIHQKAVQIGKARDDLAKAKRSVQQGGPKPFQNPKYVSEQEAAILGLGQQIMPLVTAHEPEPGVIALVKSLQDLRELVDSYKADAAKAVLEIGDVQAQLREMDGFAKGPTPLGPEQPYTAHSVSEFYVQSAAWEEKAKSHLSQVERICSDAYLPGGVDDKNLISSISGDLQYKLKTLDRESQIIGAVLDQKLRLVDSILKWFDNLDPNKRDDQANAFLGDRGAHFQRDRLENELEAIRAGVIYARNKHPDRVKEFDEAVERIEQTKEDYERKLELAVAHVRMPKAVTPSSCSYEELETISRDTLANPKYGVGKIARLVVNSDKQTKSREEKEVEVKDVDTTSSYSRVTVTTEETVTRWEWTEFQVATAESEGEKHFIYYNTLKFFTSGSSVTPLNRWVVGDRFQSIEIPLENIEKD